MIIETSGNAGEQCRSEAVSFHNLTLQALGGGGGTDFNLRERFCYLSNTYENCTTFTQIYWKTRFWIFFFVKDISYCHGSQIFDAMFSQILTFFDIFFF